MLTQISSSVFSWSEIHGAARNEPYPWNSFVIRTNHGDGLILVDPLPLSAEDEREIEAMGDPAHILLTCEYHLRESKAFRNRWGCDVRIHADGSEYSEVTIDETFQDGDRLWDMIEVIHIPDAYHTDEVALMVHGEGNTMIVGDAGSAEAGRIEAYRTVKSGSTPRSTSPISHWHENPFASWPESFIRENGFRSRITDHPERQRSVSRNSSKTIRPGRSLNPRRKPSEPTRTRWHSSGKWKREVHAAIRGVKARGWFVGGSRTLIAGSPPAREARRDDSAMSFETDSQSRAR